MLIHEEIFRADVPDPKLIREASENIPLNDYFWEGVRDPAELCHFPPGTVYRACPAPDSDIRLLINVSHHKACLIGRVLTVIEYSGADLIPPSL